MNGMYQSRQAPVADGPSVGRKNRGAKTISHYAVKLMSAHARFEKDVQRFVDCFDPVEPDSPFLTNANGLWALGVEMSYESFIEILREAQRTHPGFHWGYLEG